MDYDSCYNCGQQGHFASSCPAGVDIDTRPRPARWRPPPRLPAAEQAAINEQGVALCRRALT